MAQTIVAEPLNPRGAFNWVFLVELLICGILTIFFLFYFNRLFATLISYGIRAYTWRTFHAYIDITSLQISLLGGRIFFKDIRYHGHNETILVHGGYITWNYWLRRVRDAGVYTNEDPPTDNDASSAASNPTTRSGSRSRNVDKAEKGGKQTAKKLPCRISIKVSGVEAFMYNRSPAYDGIVEAVKRKMDLQTNDVEKEYKDEDDHHKLNKSNTNGDTIRPTTSHSSVSDVKKPDLPAFLKLLPIHVDVSKGAIVVGNENTLAIITAQFEKASGTLDAGACGPQDVYQQLFNFQVTHPVVHMKPNPDYKSSQLEAAAHIKQEAGENILDEHKIRKATGRRRRRWFSKLSSLQGLFARSSDSIRTHTKSSVETSKLFTPQWHFPGKDNWKGLARYLDDSVNDGYGEWDAVEYAKTSLIADCPCVNVSFYWDVPGPVTRAIDNSRHLDPLRPDDINGSVPPEYGMDIQVFGGTINYGPWTDRHRGIFQSFFFPGSYVDANVTNALKPGDTRVLTVFKLFLSIEEETTLRIPTREPSKDWKWKGKAHTLAANERVGADKTKDKPKARRRRGKRRDTTGAQNVRPFAWVDVKVAGNSSVNYVMDMYASNEGFQNKLDVDVASVEISSSVNHGLLWRSGCMTLDCNLSNPITWNTLRTWIFNIKCRDLELFLLRDHLFLLTDLVADWGSGPPSDYFLFVPFRYLLNVDFTNLKLYLNTNDSNIVNNPSDLDDNNFIVLSGQRLHGDVIIPLDRFRPLDNEIKFDVQGHDMGLEVLMPQKNTIKTFVKSSNVARLGGFTLCGSHTYMTETSTANTDRLFMDIQGNRLNLELYGWLVHHFMKIKDNYFGDDLHFKTLEEFQGLPNTTLAADGTDPNGQPSKIANDLDVILSITASEGTVLIPANLYSAERSIRADIAYASADLRFTNYYMDLMVNFSPLSLALGGSAASPELSNEFTSGHTELFIESTVIFGHRLFGLPPLEPTYICSWDFDIGRISGECTSEFIETAAGAARSFAFTFDDDENSLPLTEILPIHDATFLRLRTQDLHVWMHVAREAILLKTNSISLDFNDLAGNTFSQRLNARIPNLTLGGVDARSASRHRTRIGEKQNVETHAFLQTNLSIGMLSRKLDFTEERTKQQTHMQLHDQRTKRAQFMFNNAVNDSIHSAVQKEEALRPPALQFPDVAHPIFLFQPHEGCAGSVRSSPTSAYGSSFAGEKWRQGSSSATNKSIANSIRSSVRRKAIDTPGRSSRSDTVFGGSPQRVDSSERYYDRVAESERVRRNLPPSSVALSSSLATPYFPLDQIEPDLSDVPEFPDMPASPSRSKPDDLIFDDLSTSHLDEIFTHTSLLISAEPGIRLYCTPAFVECISDLIDLILPQRPDDLLDDYQVKVMSKILENRNRREGKGSSIEFSVRIPFTHIRFQHAFASDMSHKAGKDQFDVMFNQWKAVARIKSHPGERAGEDTLSLHTTLGSLGVSVTERTSHGSNQDVAIQTEIRDVLVWMLQNKATSVDVSFRLFEVAAASKKVNYLASLIHRTTVLADELAFRFAQIEQRQQHRLQYLAWYLTSVQDQYPDPAFLTKASYALRAARDHLRSHDSWKIISRFRYTWQCLPEAEKDELLDECQNDSVRCPDDAEEKIIHMWDQWRTWDLAHVKKSLAMQMLFNRLTDGLPTPETAPLYLDVKSAEIRLIGDPGPRQSEISLRFLTINLAALPPTTPSGLMLVEEDVPKKSTIVQISSQKSSVHFQWEICELVEALTELFRKEDLQAKKVVLNKPQPMQKPVAIQDDIQIVFVTEKAEIILDTVNLQSITTAQRFQLALVDEDKRALESGDILSIHVHMESAISELSSRSKSLAKAQFELPSLYFALTKHDLAIGVPDEVKVAATSSMIVIKIQEDVLELVEVSDAVLRDEVAYLVRQTEGMKEFANEKKHEDHVAENNHQLPNITLALFMDAYRVELAILQPLGWSISGSSGRIAVVPALGQNVTLQVDYDLEPSFHRMYSATANGSNIISSFKLPSLNGRVACTQTEQKIRILASGIVDQIQLQASEIQALVTTVNKPEFLHMVQAIQDDVEVLKKHAKEIFPSPSESVNAPADSARDILFQIQSTLSGIQVVANAPGRTTDSSTANLVFQISSVQLKATNIDSDQNIMAYPEAAVEINEISIGLTLTERASIRRCGNLMFSAVFHATTERNTSPPRRLFRIQSTGLEVNIFADTASAVVDVMNYLQDRIKDLDLSKEKKYLRRLRYTKSRIAKREKSVKSATNTDHDSVSSGALFTSTYALELLDLQISWIVGNSVAPYARTENEDLVLSFSKIDLSTQRDDAARLLIDDMQLQMLPASANRKIRAQNSALLPRMVFNVAYASTKDTRKVAFHAAGKSLDLRLDSHFLIPANIIEKSIALAVQKFRKASENWSMTPTTTGAQRKNPFGNKRLASLTVDASFAGAVVHINGHTPSAEPKSTTRSQQKGRYSQFVGDGSASSLALRAPGVAVKVEHQDDGHDSDLNVEVRVDSSTNTLLPTVVPVIIDISNSIKAVVRDKDNEDSSDQPEQPESPPEPDSKTGDEDSNIITADPATMLGRTRLNLGLRICKQEFSLSCQPIARVTAIAKLEDIYFTANSVKSVEHGHFFAASAAFQNLQTTVQHVYSRESTFSLDVESIVVSLMNSKHLSGTSGISAILKINPTTMQINARQLQDFLLFREIWYPPEIRQASKPLSTELNSEPQEYLIQRYEQVTAATAFPWNANVAIADIKIDLDLGQAIGKSSLHINNMWASSKKSTNWEQNLCIGVEKIGVESSGRTSGFVELHGIKVRTSIGWPAQTPNTRRTPLIQASIAFRQLRVKSGFDYQAFVMADIANFGFLMYNVRDETEDAPDRLVAILDGDKVHVFCHATSAAQGLALFQAVERLVQENQQAYKQSLKDIEKFLRRKSSVAIPFDRSPSQSQILAKSEKDAFKAPISLQTDVVVTLRSIQFGVYPSTFVDTQILLLSAGDMQARFAVALEKEKIHSTLGMTLGQLSVALSAISTPKKTRPVAELTLEDVVESARSARGGTILRVPKVLAIMHTWQAPASNHIDYLFRSTLEGKVDVGWNYSRISYIRTMWSNHSRSLASRLGKPLPESNIKISTSQTLPDLEEEEEESTARPRAKSDAGQEKITAVVNVPQSKYEYTPLEPPLIETPQLRDMGEATPPLEWIGLHRDRLPNVTHQIVIVTLLEVAREVEDAYGRILGSS